MLRNCGEIPQDAEDILLKIAKGNNRNVSLKQREEIRNILSRVEKDSHQETNLNFLNMFKGQKISEDI